MIMSYKVIHIITERVSEMPRLGGGISEGATVSNLFYMRSVLTVSLPPDLIKEVKKITRKNDYLTVSEFVRDVMTSFIEDQQLLEDLAISRAEFAAGKGIPIKKASDLFDRLK